jgi:hypothetical protein
VSERLTNDSSDRPSEKKGWSELLDLYEKHYRTPSELRRLAELTEWIFDREAADKWWRLAAAAGDRDAQDVVKLMDEEEGGAKE